MILFKSLFVAYSGV